MEIHSTCPSSSATSLWAASTCRRESRFTGEDLPEDLEDDRETVVESIIRKEEYRSLYHAIGLLPGDGSGALSSVA